MSENKSLTSVMAEQAVRDRFAEVLGKNPSAFISSVLTVANSNNQLKECDPMSILNAAGVAAALNLPVTPALGFAYIVPRKVKGNYTAYFQLGYKGWIQLAFRSGQFVRLNSREIYEGEFAGFDPFTGDPVKGNRISDKIVGYMAYLRLVNGFEHYEYMSVDQLKDHAKKYSPGYAYDLKNGKDSSTWSTNFDAMAKKTVLTKLMKTYGAVSLDLQKAVEAETSRATEEPLENFVDIDTGEIVTADGTTTTDFEALANVPELADGDDIPPLDI